MNVKFVLDTPENRAYLNSLSDELLEFGINFPAPKGGSCYLMDNGSPDLNLPVQTWITSRMLHVYSIGAMMGFKKGKELAQKALSGLNGILKDNVNGGWYSGVNADGTTLSGKLCYAHAFVILSSSSALLAKIEGAEDLLKEALEIYDKYFWDEDEGLSKDNYNTAFTLLDDYRGANANMHTVEAFLGVADAAGDETYRLRAGRIIKRIVEFAKNNDYRIPEHYTKNWKPDLNCNQDKPDDPFKPYGATPGHGIEWSRLITQWAVSSAINDDEKTYYINQALKLYDRAIEDGWDADGAAGIVYTTDWKGKPVVHDRMHWTLAEAINASAVLYRATGLKKYTDEYAMFMEYLDSTVHDRINGSWFHQLDRNNKVIGTVWPGKPDIYHAFQAMNIPYLEIGLSIAAAVKKMSL